MMTGQFSQENIFRSLAEITSAIGGSTRFSKILSDASLPITAKIKVLNDVTGGALGETGDVVDVLKTVLAASRPSSEPLSQYLLSITANAGFDAAAATQKTGDAAAFRIAKVEEGLRGFADLVAANTGLRFALTNPGASDASKAKLVGELLDGKADIIAVTLLRVLLHLEHGSDIETSAKALADIAAKRQGHVVADVRTAIELDQNYQNKLAAALTVAVGKKVEPRFVVDPSIVGSVVVRVGDEVWDGSVRQRLDQARLALTGQS